MSNPELDSYDRNTSSTTLTPTRSRLSSSVIGVVAPEGQLKGYLDRLAFSSWLALERRRRVVLLEGRREALPWEGG